MPEREVFPLTIRLAWIRLRSSKPAWASALVFPAGLVCLGLRDSYATMMEFFLFLAPHLFLLAAGDMASSEVKSGVLENVLFVGGAYRAYLWRKNFVLAGAAALYATALFVTAAVWGAARGSFDPSCLPRFAAALLAGSCYVAVAGAASYALRAGSNVVVILFLQAAAVVGLLFSAASRSGFIDGLASGHFPGLGSRLAAGGLALLLPNIIVFRRMSMFTPVVVAGLGLGLLVQRAVLRRLELRR